MYTKEQIELAWIAGFMDGEGTITIKKYSRYKNQSIRYQAYVCCVQAIENNTEAKKAMELLKNKFGGGLKYTKGASENRRGTVQWVVVSSTAIECVKQLLPYLVIKKKQAELLIEYGKNIKSNRGAKRLTDEILQERYNHWFNMRKLNVRGKNHLQRLNEETA